MVKSKNIFISFRFKIILVLVSILFLSGVISSFLVYKYSIRSRLDQLKSKLIVVAEALSIAVDPDMLINIPLDKDGVNSQEYKAIEKKLLKIKESAPTLAYVYILKKTDTPGVLKFIMDIHTGNYETSEVPAGPGEQYDASLTPRLMKAFDGPTVDEAMVADKWGLFLSGYAPIRDNSGKAIAVIGIDVSADDIYRVEKETRSIIIMFFAAGLILSVLLGTIVSSRVTYPVKKLTEGIRHISSGDLAYRVNIKGSDEIGELGNAFNGMAADLSEARRKLVEYFYRVAQSLIRVMEARDPYTKGHSDRVADYSVKIASKLGLPEDKMVLLKEAALLHDIGKLGVQEMVLNKTGALSDEDRQIIRKHPAIGEDILKPVSDDKDLLAIVRGHHERYDGKGYPDALAGDKIDMLVAIVSAADSYDAMTSHRAYRVNLSKDEAVKQLQIGSGSQFNPQVVDAFIKVLKEPS